MNHFSDSRSSYERTHFKQLKIPSMKKNYFLKVLLITLIGLGTNLNAQTTTWTGATSSDFNLSTNWDNGSPEGQLKM